MVRQPFLRAYNLFIEMSGLFKSSNVSSYNDSFYWDKPEDSAYGILVKNPVCQQAYAERDASQERCGKMRPNAI